MNSEDNKVHMNNLFLKKLKFYDKKLFPQKKLIISEPIVETQKLKYKVKPEIKTNYNYLREIKMREDFAQQTMIINFPPMTRNMTSLRKRSNSETKEKKKKVHECFSLKKKFKDYQKNQNDSFFTKDIIPLNSLKDFLLRFMLNKEIKKEDYNNLNESEKNIFKRILERKNYRVNEGQLSKVTFKQILDYQNLDLFKNNPKEKERIILNEFQRWLYSKWKKHQEETNPNYNHKEIRKKDFFEKYYDSNWVLDQFNPDKNHKKRIVEIDFKKLNKKKDSLKIYIKNFLKSKRLIEEMNKFLRSLKEFDGKSLFELNYEKKIKFQIQNKFNFYESIQTKVRDKMLPIEWIEKEIKNNQKHKLPHSIFQIKRSVDYFLSTYENQFRAKIN